MASRNRPRLVVLAAAAAFLGVAGLAQAQPFPLNGLWTYQGRLTDAGAPANGQYDIQIAIYDRPAGGGVIALSFHNNINVTNGLFTIPDVSTGFLGTFQGDRRWAEIQVRPGASVGAFTILAPRQELTATPYAMWANRAATAGTVNNHTLDAAYDSGGAGAGRTITSDSGAVAILGAGGLTVETNVAIGDADTSGGLQMFYASPTRNFELRPHGGSGGAVEGYDESGATRTYFLEPDINGEGGFFSVHRDGGSAGFTVDGMTTGGDPVVTISGDTRSMSFSPGAAVDNNSVILPVDSIASPEILDEPGAASDNRLGPTFAAAGTFTVLSSQSITIPADGYVLAIANAEIVFAHVVGTATRCTFGLSTVNNSLSINQDFETSLASALPTGSYDFTSSAHCLFTLAAGTHTIFFLGREDSGNVSLANDTWLTLLYIPTAYGVVDPRGGGDGPDEGEDHIVGRPVIDDAAIIAQQDQAEQLNTERLAREVADLKAQLAELRKLVTNATNHPAGR